MAMTGISRRREPLNAWVSCFVTLTLAGQATAQEPGLESLPPLVIEEAPARPSANWPPTATAPLISPRPVARSVQFNQDPILGETPVVGVGAPIVVERPLLAQAEQLVFQIDDFVLNFGPQVASVPDGRKILADAQKLSIRANRFREAVRVANFDHISKLYRQLRAESDDLVRHVSRVSKGRTGPNIQRVGLIATTTSRIGAMLR